MSDQEVWRGLFKLVEEAGELQQVLGKLGVFPEGRHATGKKLIPALEEELADMIAAIDYFIDENSLDMIAINERVRKKRQKFDEWGLTGVPIDE